MGRYILLHTKRGRGEREQKEREGEISDRDVRKRKIASFVGGERNGVNRRRRKEGREGGRQTRGGRRKNEAWDSCVCVCVVE